MKKIDPKVFEPYLYEKDSIRPALEKPFLSGDYIVASDSYVLLRIKKDLVEGTFELPKYPPKVENAIPDTNCSLILTADQLSTALVSVEREEEMEEVYPEIECPECDGDGEVEWEYYDRDNIHHARFFECPHCNGTGIFRKAVTRPTGRMRVKEYAAIVINGANFWADQLQTLHDTMATLEINEVEIQSLRKEKPCLIRLADGIDFVAMSFSERQMASSVFYLNIMPS